MMERPHPYHHVFHEMRHLDDIITMNQWCEDNFGLPGDGLPGDLGNWRYLYTGHDVYYFKDEKHMVWFIMRWSS